MNISYDRKFHPTRITKLKTRHAAFRSRGRKIGQGILLARVFIHSIRTTNKTLARTDKSMRNFAIPGRST